MTELFTFIIGVGFLALIGWAGFLMGRDRAESAAAETIANLRRQVLITSRQRDRAVENNARLARALRLHDPVDPPTPEWMQP
jgi:hypothetical protein